MCALDPLQRDLVKCEDMRLHAERAVAFLGKKTLGEFQADDMLQAAVIRCVEVVGEAARQVSQDTRFRAPEIPWSRSSACATFWPMTMASWTLDEFMAWSPNTCRSSSHASSRCWRHWKRTSGGTKSDLRHAHTW
jgi:hypothetical protein